MLEHGMSIARSTENGSGAIYRSRTAKRALRFVGERIRFQVANN